MMETLGLSMALLSLKEDWRFVSTISGEQSVAHPTAFLGHLSTVAWFVGSWVTWQEVHD